MNPSNNPFPFYANANPTQQQDAEQLRLQQQQQQQQQQVQFQAQQQQQSHYTQFPNAPQYMAAPTPPPALQQQHQNAAFYANQQADVQNRLAHLQLQHPQQLQRQDRPPSPTRRAPFAPNNQPYLSNSNRGIVNRNTAGFSRNTLDRAEATRVKLEHLYKVSVEQAVERNSRYFLHARLII
jgi:protein-serine/threonine kinase